MDYCAGIDVSLEYSSVCVVDASGKIVRETKVASEPEALIAWFASVGFGLARIGPSPDSVHTISVRDDRRLTKQAASAAALKNAVAK